MTPDIEQLLAHLDEYQVRLHELISGMDSGNALETHTAILRELLATYERTLQELAPGPHRLIGDLVRPPTDVNAPNEAEQ